MCVATCCRVILYVVFSLVEARAIYGATSHLMSSAFVALSLILLRDVDPSRHERSTIRVRERER